MNALAYDSLLYEGLIIICLSAGIIAIVCLKAFALRLAISIFCKIKRNYLKRKGDKPILRLLGVYFLAVTITSGNGYVLSVANGNMELFSGAITGLLWVIQCVALGLFMNTLYDEAERRSKDTNTKEDHTLEEILIEEIPEEDE